VGQNLNLAQVAAVVDLPGAGDDEGQQRGQDPQLGRGLEAIFFFPTEKFETDEEAQQGGGDERATACQFWASDSRRSRMPCMPRFK